jgi:hypothetical protein
MVWFLVQFGKTYTREFFNDFKLVSCNFDTRACFFQIALETILLPIYIRRFLY